MLWHPSRPLPTLASRQPSRKPLCTKELAIGQRTRIDTRPSRPCPVSPIFACIPRADRVYRRIVSGFNRTGAGERRARHIQLSTSGRVRSVGSHRQHDHCQPDALSEARCRCTDCRRCDDSISRVPCEATKCSRPRHPGQAGRHDARRVSRSSFAKPPHVRGSTRPTPASQCRSVRKPRRGDPSR